MRLRQNTGSARPMARSEGLLVEVIGDETVIYDLESKEAHCLKALAAAVFAYADGRNSFDDIAELVAYRLGTSVSPAEVSDAIAQLEQAGLLDVPIVVLNRNGVSRREMLRRVGFAGAAAAVATPLITSLAVPSTALALSGVPPGCSGCGSNSDCIKQSGPGAGHCCQSVPGKSCNQACCVGDNNSCHISTCTCSISAVDCTTTACATGGGTCVCKCTACLVTCPTACPPNSSICCTQAINGVC